MLGALALGATAGLAQLMLAALCFLLCMALPLRSTALSRRAGASALGVYLVHPLILSLLGRLTPLAPDSSLMALLACALALAVSLCLLLASGRCALPVKPPYGRLLAKPLHTPF